MNLSASDYIELLGIFVSSISSIIAIIISVKTLKQSSKMIEESTRPLIGIYISATHVKELNHYLIIKNFGQTPAFIEYFSYDFDLSSLSTYPGYHPFKNIEHSTLLPQQSYKCFIDLNEIIKQVQTINFQIIYKSEVHTYTDNLCVNLIADIGNAQKHNAANDLSSISATLQDMNISSL